MRNLLFSLLILGLMVSSCSSDDSPLSPTEENNYQLQDLNSYLTEDDQNSFVFEHLDTLTYINDSDTALSDTTFYPYQSLKDSLFVEIAPASGDAVSLKDSVAFRPMLIRPDRKIGYLSKDSVYISALQDTILRPIAHKSEAITLKRDPKIRYDITGAYWRVRYSISFTGKAVRIGDKKEIPFDGKLFYSTVSRGARPEGAEDKAPTTSVKMTDVP